MSKYRFLVRTSARSSLAYWGDLLASSLFLLLILFIFLKLWRVTYASTGSQLLAGLTLPQLLWYLGAAESLSLSRPRITPEVDADVRTGALAVHLLRPLSYPLYRLATHLGERLLRLGLYLVLAVGLCWLFTQEWVISPRGFLLFALALPLALLLDFLAYFLIGLGAFWLEDTQGLTLLYSRLQLLLGGTLLPLPLFPDWMQQILSVLPFAGSVYGPARLFVAPDGHFLGQVWLRQGVAVGLLWAAVAAVFHLAVRRVEAQGG